MPVQAAPVVPVSSNLGCDPLDAAACLLPFPNDLFTTADATTATGRRIDFNPAAMPRGGAEVTEGGEGKPIDPLEWNRNDGFSPGSMVITYVPDLDLHVTWGTQDRPHSDVGINEPGYFDYRDHITDIGLYQNDDAPMVILNTATGERHPFWSELDIHPGAVGAGEQLLILRPAVNFEEGTRYVVALRNLKRTDGSVIEPEAEFATYLAGSGERQAYFDTSIFPTLDTAGIAKDDLYLAWDFTVASERNLAERMLHMRDDAFGRILGDTDLTDGTTADSAVPDFVVDSTEDRNDTWTDSHGQPHTQQIRRVRGRVTVPNYMDRIQQTEGHVQASGQASVPAVGGVYYDIPAPGSRLLDLDLDGLPDQNPAEPEVNVPFVCDVVLDGDARYGVLYGHGLLGTRDQIGDVRSPRRNGPFYGCAADWWGMSTSDVPTVLAILTDLSHFPSLADRAQQGFLNFMLLGRAMIHPDGFATDPAFQQDGASLIANGHETPLYYDGNSQGGIMGGSLVAVSPDIDRAILGVPGMNYSTLLNRSVDWEGELVLEPDLPAYSVPFYAQYQDPVERQVVFSLMQMLWDRGEANGYAQHMTTDPLPNTPRHDVMLQVAFSDHQVANVSAEVEGRTIGAPIMVPGLADGRHWEAEPYFSETATYPHQGSALVYWDSGNATPPNGNLPPDHNGDPHGHPRSEPAAGWQEAHFLLTGQMVDVCNGGLYLTDNNPVNGGAPSCLEPDFPAGRVIPESVATTLAYTGATSGQYSDVAVLQASLTETDSGAPIAGAEVTFQLTGPDGTSSLTAISGDDGVARVEEILTERPGDYVLAVSFAGTEGLDASRVEAPFRVDREDTTTTLTVQDKDKDSEPALVAQLLDGDSNQGIGGQLIEFYVDGERLGIASTDENGVATLPLPTRSRGKKHSYEARFLGDDYYLESSGTLSEACRDPKGACRPRS
jgi:hypothetical protein